MCFTHNKYELNKMENEYVLNTYKGNISLKIWLQAAILRSIPFALHAAQ